MTAASTSLGRSRQVWPILLVHLVSICVPIPAIARAGCPSLGQADGLHSSSRGLWRRLARYRAIRGKPLTTWTTGFLAERYRSTVTPEAPTFTIVHDCTACPRSLAEGPRLQWGPGSWDLTVCPPSEHQSVIRTGGSHA
jgi:hypothetical protein